MAGLCRRLTEAGLGDAAVSVGERLSYPEERITRGRAEALKDRSFDPLSVALIENERAEGAPAAFGLPDEAFTRGSGEEGVVPMTKSEVRAVCLSKLDLTEDALCWDVGAGTGSVAIEMARLAKRGHVYAIERKEAALALLEKNKAAFGTDNMTIVPGAAPEACAGLPAPTHAFIGGSSGNLKEILALLLEKNPAVRIVATAVSLESAAELTGCMSSFEDGEAQAISLTVARGRKAGRYHLMNGQNPIYIFTLQRGNGR